MFGIDAYTFETVWPSLGLVAIMIAALVWGWFKVRDLMDQDGDK